MKVKVTGIFVLLTFLFIFTGCGADKVLQDLEQADLWAQRSIDTTEWLMDKLETEGLTEKYPLFYDSLLDIIYTTEESQKYINEARNNYLNEP